MEQFHSSKYFLFVLPLMAAAIVLEAYFYRRRFGRPYPWGESATSIGVGIGHQLTGVVNQIVIQGLMATFVWEHRLFTVPADAWWSWPALFVALEFAYYWYHRAAHEVHWMWATHSTHHSPNEMVLSAAYRLGWTPLLSLSWLFFLPLVWLGFDPVHVFGLLAVSLLYQFWLHTRLIPPLRWVEGILNTPSAHRVHHASNPEFLDRNYGGMLIVFDRIFGTYAVEQREEDIRYGTVHPIVSLNPLTVVFTEWLQMLRGALRARSWGHRARVLLDKPGWSPPAT